MPFEAIAVSSFFDTGADPVDNRSHGNLLSGTRGGRASGASPSGFILAAVMGRGLVERHQLRDACMAGGVRGVPSELGGTGVPR